jgi:hypothetical protein
LDTKWTPRAGGNLSKAIASFLVMNSEGPSMSPFGGIRIRRSAQCRSRDDPPVHLLNDLRQNIEQRQLPGRWLPDTDDGDVAPIVQEPVTATTEEGQGSDVAAGWATDIYCGADTYDDGVRRLCAQFRGVIVNGKLLQR